MPFEAWLRMKGWDITRLTYQEVRLLRACWLAECPRPAAPGAVQGPAKPMIQASKEAGSSGPFRFYSTPTIKLAEGEGAKLATFSGNCYTGSVMRPGGWFNPVIIDLLGVKFQNQNCPVFRQHDPEQILGHCESLSVEKDGIKVAGVFSGEDRYTVSVVVPAGKNFPWQMSVGADPIRTEFLEAGEETQVNGITVTGPLIISRETEIKEISFVPLGADSNTSATVQAQKGRGTMNEWKLALKRLMAELRAAGGVKAKAAKYSDDEVDNMSDADCRAALKKAMKAADDEPDDDDEDDDKKKADAARQAGIEAARETVRTMREEAARETQRQADVTTRIRAHGVTECEVEVGGTRTRVNLTAHAIQHGWTPDQAELHALRAARPGAGVGVPGGLGYATSRPEISEAVLEAAVLHAGRSELFDDSFFGEKGDRGKVPARDRDRIQRELQARYPDQVQQAAHTLFKGRIRLQQVLTSLAAANGYRGSDSIRDDDTLASVAHHCMIRAEGASTASIANVLANVLNKFLLQGYLYTEQAWKEIAGIRPVNDFKPTKSVNLFGNFQFEKVADSGELKNAALQDQAFANQVDQTGKIITLSRKSIINDDLGALTTVPMLMGRGAGLYLNDLFWSTFLNPGKDEGGSTNFFAATHTITNQTGNSNLSTGAGSALSAAGLTAAVLLFDNQVDPMGFPLGVDAETLLYPPDLETTARELMNAQFLVYGGGTASRQPNTNIFQGRFKPVKSRYLNKSVYTGNSTTAWWLLGNPGVIPVIEVAFLNGTDMPTVQQAGPDFQFNMLGISIRGIFDCGVSMQQFRGAVKSNGA